MSINTTSYWHKTTKDEARAALSELPAQTEMDAVVIGGGLLGTCATYWLARQGTRVLQIDQGGLATGATGRNGGFMTIGAAMSYPEAIKTFGHAAALEMWQLTYASVDLLREVLQAEQLDCDYREPGTLTLALNEQELSAMQNSALHMCADGMPVEVLGRTQVQSLIPTPLGPDICGAKFYAKGGLLHSARFINSLAKAAQRYGARTSVATVQAMKQVGNNIELSTSAGTVRTNALIIGANAWTNQLVPSAKGIVTPVRGQILSYEPIERVFTPGIGAAVTPTGEYWQQTMDGSIVLGGCRAVHPTKDVDILSTETTTDVIEAIEQVLPRLFPKLANLKVSMRWAGQMAFTPDYLPVLDAVPGLRNAWFTGGFCGHGMPFGMIFGKLLAEAVKSGQLAPSLHHFSAGRPTLG